MSTGQFIADGSENVALQNPFWRHDDSREHTISYYGHGAGGYPPGYGWGYDPGTSQPDIGGYYHAPPPGDLPHAGGGVGAEIPRRLDDGSPFGPNMAGFSTPAEFPDFSADLDRHWMGPWWNGAAMTDHASWSGSAWTTPSWCPQGGHPLPYSDRRIKAEAGDTDLLRQSGPSTSVPSPFVLQVSRTGNRLTV